MNSLKSAEVVPISAVLAVAVPLAPGQEENRESARVLGSDGVDNGVGFRNYVVKNLNDYIRLDTLIFPYISFRKARPLALILNDHNIPVS